MRVVDVRDFCVPSDENDYDELVAFADTMASIPQFDAVPMSVIEDIKADVKSEKENRIYKDQFDLHFNNGLDKALEIIEKHTG